MEGGINVAAPSFYDTMACKAIKPDYSFCRCWATPGADYCHAHRNMTPELYKERWFGYFIVGKRKSGVDRVFHYYFGRPHTSLAPILKTLRSGEIRLTDKDIASIPSRDRYIDVFVCLLSNGFVDEKSNPQILVRAFSYFIRSHLYFADTHIPQFMSRNILLDEITTILRTRPRSLAAFVYTLPDVLESIRTYSNTQEIFCPLLTGLLETDAAKELSWIPKTGAMASRYEKTEIGKQYLHFLQGRWLPDLKELYQAEKQTQKAKADHFKEELMMVCWHPDRISRWIEMGLEPADM